jgi:hypothetical protein
VGQALRGGQERAAVSALRHGHASTVGKPRRPRRRIAVGIAMRASAADLDDFGYPWVDRKRGAVVVAAATPSGLVRAATVRAALPGVATAVADVARSRSSLEQIMDEVIGRQPDGTQVLESYPDPEHNRIVAVVSELRDTFPARNRNQPTRAVHIRRTSSLLGVIDDPTRPRRRRGHRHRHQPVPSRPGCTSNGRRTAGGCCGYG